jgi:hypothetical protein
MAASAAIIQANQGLNGKGWKDARHFKDENIGPAPGIYVAVLQAASDEETAHLGVALLCRNESLADRPFKYGGAMYDPRFQMMADAIGWWP